MWRCRILIWNLFDSETMTDELRESLPELVSPSCRIWNEASERFGGVFHGEELSESVDWATDLSAPSPTSTRRYELLAV